MPGGRNNSGTDQFKQKQQGKISAPVINDDNAVYNLLKETTFVRIDASANFPIRIVGCKPTQYNVFTCTIFVSQGATQYTASSVVIDGVTATQLTIFGSIKPSIVQTFKINGIYVSSAWRVTIHIDSDIMDSSFVLPSKKVVTTQSTGNRTVTAAEALGGYYHMDGDSGGSTPTLTIDTAANIVAALNNPIVGTSFELHIQNTATGGGEKIVFAGSGVAGITFENLSGSSADIPENFSRRYLIICTNVTASSEAVTVRQLGKSDMR